MTDHVEVTGHGAHHVIPDLVILRARVQCEARDIASALTESSNRTAAALQAASDHGIEPRDRHTDDVGIHPRHDQNGRKVIGYTAYQAFRLTVRDRDHVGDVLQALAGAAGDALAVDGIEMGADQTVEAVAAVRDAAFETPAPAPPSSRASPTPSWARSSTSTRAASMTTDRAR